MIRRIPLLIDLDQLRGPTVPMEFLPAATVQNLRKLAKRTQAPKLKPA
jgi:hypothetical protein